MKLQKTTFQDEIAYRYDLFGGELLVKIVRELRKVVPNVTSDQQSKAWIWRGAGVEKDPWYWVKVNASGIVMFSGFFVGASNWGEFRANVRGVLLEALSGIETDFVENLTANYAWVVPRVDLGKRLPDLMKFSGLVLPEEAYQSERFSTLLYNPDTKRRVLFEGTPEAGEDEFKFGLSVQTNTIDRASLANVFR